MHWNLGLANTVVLGCGIVALWTADVLSRAGHKVTISAASEYANSTSAAAAGVLVPLFPGDPESNQFKTCMRWAGETLQHMLSTDNNSKFLERMPCYEFGLAGEVEYGFPLYKLDYVDYFSTFTVVNLNRMTAGCDVAIRFDCYLCNSMVFMRSLFNLLKRRGVKFQFFRLNSLADLEKFEADFIFNCTGYQSIFPDPELYPVFGQSMYIPVKNQPAPLFGLGAGEHSVFKHKRGFHVGAYFIPGNGDIRPRGDLYARSVEFVRTGFAELCESVGIEPPPIDITKAERVNAGVRPFRASGPRVETERFGDKLVIHNYGHGAHGWTIGYGSAMEAVALAGLLP
jgi:glycine/D-amino acid oxidase-like deaminating enzyme